MLSLMFFTKLFVTVGTVLGLSVIAEHAGPKAAGILAGYPLGAAIALFFIGVENSPKFAADSAVYTLIGLVATQAFVYFYFKATVLVRRLPVLAASLASVSGYFLVIWLLHFLKPTKELAVVVPIASVFFFLYLFREIPNVSIAKKIDLSIKVVTLRSLLAACIILLITGAAKFVGPAWAGLFSAFPTTLFPLLLIVHLTYSKEHVHTIIKNFPLGLGSLISYSLAVSILYPLCGVYLGTVLSFAAATGYLLLYRFCTVRAQHAGREGLGAEK